MTISCHTDILVYLFIACGTLLFSGVPGPIFRGILSRTVDSDEQGRFMFKIKLQIRFK